MKIFSMAYVKKLLHTRMRVENLDKTVDFYTRVFGLEVSMRKTSPRGSQLVFLRTPGSEEEIELTSFPASGPVNVPPDLMHLAFQVEDMEAFRKHAEACGYPFSDGPQTTASGSVIAFIDAPEGYEVELIQKHA